LSDYLIGLIPIYGPWVIFGVVALESAGVPLPGETILVGAALLASTTDQISIITVVTAAAAGAIVGDSTGYAVGRRFGLPMLEKYGHYIHLDKDRLLIGRYLFFQYGSVIVFVGRFVAVLRMFAALLAGASGMPWVRFLFFNVSGGICWASSFGFGAHAVGSAIYKISEVASVIAFILFIVTGFTLSRVIRHYEPVLLSRAEQVFSNRPGSTRKTSA
jgi:membrane protein DedA with SNARE-associated domain